jgi:hypothetical protein
MLIPTPQPKAGVPLSAVAVAAAATTPGSGNSGTPIKNAPGSPKENAFNFKPPQAGEVT